MTGENALRNILVIKLGALGDFIQALGPMAAIRSHHPDASITLLTTAPFEQLARQCGYFDNVIVDSRPKLFDIGGWMVLRNKLNRGKFQRVYDLQNNDRTAIYLKLFSPRPEWVGAAAGASHRNNSPERTAGRAYDGHVQTLSLAGIHNISPDEMGWMQSDKTFGQLKKPYVLIVPGSAPGHPEKRWPAVRYAALCEWLGVSGYRPVLIGGPAEQDVLAAIHAAAPQSLNLGGQTSLFDLPSLARGAAGAVGNDTGPMHLIAPTGCPTLVLFSGRTNPKRHAPLGRNVATLQKESLDDLDVEEVRSAFSGQHGSA